MRPGTVDQDLSTFLTLSMVPGKVGTHSMNIKGWFEEL